jgi:hypothetical protein
MRRNRPLVARSRRVGAAETVTRGFAGGGTVRILPRSSNPELVLLGQPLPELLTSASLPSYSSPVASRLPTGHALPGDEILRRPQGLPSQRYAICKPSAVRRKSLCWRLSPPRPKDEPGRISPATGRIRPVAVPGRSDHAASLRERAPSGREAWKTKGARLLAPLGRYFRPNRVGVAELCSVEPGRGRVWELFPGFPSEVEREAKADAVHLVVVDVEIGCVPVASGVAAD